MYRSGQTATGLAISGVVVGSSHGGRVASAGVDVTLTRALGQSAAAVLAKHAKVQQHVTVDVETIIPAPLV